MDIQMKIDEVDVNTKIFKLIHGLDEDVARMEEILKATEKTRAEKQKKLGLPSAHRRIILDASQIKYYQELDPSISLAKELKLKVKDVKKKNWAKFSEGKASRKKLVDYSSSLRNSLMGDQALKLGSNQWKYLAQEIDFMAKDFRNETKTKISQAKKTVALARRQYDKMKNSKKREKKQMKMKMKSNCAKLSREVKTYWEKIDKLAIFQLKQKLKVKQEKKMEKHLDKIIRRTEKYSSALVSKLEAESSDDEGDYSDGDEYDSENSDDYEIEDDLEPNAEEAAAELAALQRDAQSSEKQEEESSKRKRVDDEEEELKLGVESAPKKLKTDSNENEEENKNEEQNQNEAQNENVEESSMEVLETKDENTEEVVAVVPQFKYKQPFLLAPGVHLRGYQRAGLDWLVGLYKNNLNGILADEMGLGKTIQTISLFAFLAGFEGLWGPHLIIVPSSVVMNWELEFKRFFPGFKVLAYFGSLQERKEKRAGWTKTGNLTDLRSGFNVLITSYKLAVQDAQLLKRRKWGYMVLDEAHHIKNFKSQRWQTLLNFNAKRRLLLTGTPLQNSLIELWSLLHFLMPNVFTSHAEFKHWFANPLTKFIETHTTSVTYTKTDVLSREKGKSKSNEPENHVNGKNGQDTEEGDKDLLASLSDGAPVFVKKLHSIINPFILRRKKIDVLKELPKKYEHVVKIKMSLRQQKLYEDFISRKKTKHALVSGGYLGMMQILMKLRMVCNHPDIFEPRMVSSSFRMEPLTVVSEVKKYRRRIRESQFLRLSNVRDALSENLKASLDFSLFNVSSVETSRSKASIEELDDNQNVSDFFASKSNSYTHGAVSLEFTKLVETLDQKHRRTRTNKSKVVQNLEPFIKPIYSRNLLHCCNFLVHQGGRSTRKRPRSYTSLEQKHLIDLFVQSSSERVQGSAFLLSKITTVVRKVSSGVIQNSFCKATRDLFSPVDLRFRYNNIRDNNDLLKAQETRSTEISCFHDLETAQKMAFPDIKLTEFDSGKLIFLKKLLSKLASTNKRNSKENNKVLIFTQMTRMLDILETFLSQNNFTYVRLDGSTDIRRRQILMQKFNTDYNVFAFILSTRSGGLGINLTGANNVVFYDSDWNPQVDLQAQDRAHRIGQTRNVNIYRMVCEKSIEENIFLKQRQKRQLSFVSVDFKRMRKDLLNNLTAVDDETPDEAQKEPEDKEKVPETPDQEDKDIMAAMLNAEDETDRTALATFNSEVKAQDDDDFDDAASVKTSGTGNLTRQNSAMAQPSVLESSLSPIDKSCLEHRLATTNYDAILKDSMGSEILDEFLENESDTSEFDNEEPFSDSELLAAKNEYEDDEAADVEEDFHNLRDEVKLGRKIRALTGKAWIAKYEKVIHDKVQRNGAKTTLRKYYYNIDSNEASYLRPRILDYYPKIEAAYKKGWGFLPENILVNIYLFLRGNQTYNNLKLVNSNYYLASKSTKLFVWVSYNVEPGNQNRFKALSISDGLFTVGERVECLYQRGEIYYAGVVSNVYLTQDSVTKEIHPMYEVAYPDGSTEKQVLEKFLRKDCGARFTFIYHDNKIDKINKQKSRFHMTIRSFNKHHSSSFGCGVPNTFTVFKDIYSAVKNAYNGDTLVLKTGVHHLISRYNDYLHILDKAKIKNVRIITEATLIKDLKLHNKVDELIWYDQIDALEPKFKSSRGVNLKDGTWSNDRLCRNRYTKHPTFIKKSNLHPLADVTIAGVEMPFRSKLAEIADKKENNNSYGINLTKHELSFGSLLVLHETSLYFTELPGKLSFDRVLIYYNRINKDVLKTNNLQTNKLQNMFILKGNCKLFFTRCLLNCRFMINNAFRLLHASSQLYLFKTSIKSAKKSSVLMETGQLGCWHNHFSNSSISAVTLRFGSCFFQGNVVTMKSNVGVLVEGFSPDKDYYSQQPFTVANSAMNSMISYILAERYNQKLKAVIAGNVFETKTDKQGNALGKPTPIEIVEEARRVPICNERDEANYFSTKCPTFGRTIEKFLPQTKKIVCYNNLYGESTQFSDQPYGKSFSQMTDYLRVESLVGKDISELRSSLDILHFSPERIKEMESRIRELFAHDSSDEDDSVKSENEDANVIKAEENDGMYHGPGKSAASLRSTPVVISKPKKKRGRPAKKKARNLIVDPSPSVASSTSTAPVKRKRGRPRKHPVVE